MAARISGASVRTNQSGLTSTKRTMRSLSMTMTAGCGSSAVPVLVSSPIQPGVG